MTRYAVCISLLFLCALMALFTPVAHTQHTQPPSNEKTTTGSIGFFAGNTSLPLYPRGEGRGQRWRGELDLEGRSPHHRFAWGLSAEISGGSIIDNPDACSFQFFFKTRMANGFFIGISHRDAYALNHLIVGDIAARRLESSVNSWWIDLSYKKESPVRTFSAGYSYMLAGNEPLFATHFTHPYAKHSLFGMYERHLSHGITLRLDAHLTSANVLNKFRLDLAGAIEKELPYAPAWSVELRGFTSRNFGTGALTKYNGESLHNPCGILFGVRYRF